jgi:hypothetical protein
MLPGRVLRLLQFLKFRKRRRPRIPMESWTSTKLTQSLSNNFSRQGKPSKLGVLVSSWEWLRLRNFSFLRDCDNKT